ncbi:MAG: beta-N-acetylhexosaminidase [Oscillospiraceae bacterium]|jgi:hypothetical protein|nr:beta-N-acetylhexosaminidase [Oscillospiraceae bacterium]
MFDVDNINEIKSAIFELTNCRSVPDIQVKQGEGLTVTLRDGKAEIEACDLTAVARGYFLLARAVSQGESRWSVRQKRHFENCGAYLDMSRGGVMTTDAVKRYIRQLAALGMNMLMLYTEDTYEVPEFPYFGYLRGRYSRDELREMDAYARRFGVELVPGIQTLAHLGNFLQWAPSDHLKDTQYCLMIDDPETYELIDRMLAALASCCTSRSIHIGMDEAHGVGLARYFERHGLVDRFEMLNRHLTKVVALCNKHGFKPIMWSDMFFRLGSKTGEYYDKDVNIPQSVIDSLPDVSFAYWDYYHTDEDMYEFMLTEHERMKRPIVFAGGIWTWSGFLPQVELTYATMLPALRVCARHNISTALATLWGDDGQETNHFLASNQLPIFSEFCWRGPDCDPDEMIKEIEDMGAFLTGLTAETYRAFGAFYEGAKDRRTGKGLIYCDPLYPLISEKSNLNERIQAYTWARETLAKQPDRDEVRYADLLFEIAAAKARLIQDIRSAYDLSDKSQLIDIADRRIPILIGLYHALVNVHRAQWESAFKRNGWEVMVHRYGSVIARLDDVAHTLRRFTSGELPRIAELDETPLPPARKLGMQFYNVYVTPQF